MCLIVVQLFLPYSSTGFSSLYDTGIQPQRGCLCCPHIKPNNNKINTKKVALSYLEFTLHSVGGVGMEFTTVVG